MNKRTVGSQYESEAANYLIELGYIILEQNFRCHIGEIDLIAKDQAYLVFVEVKYRKNKNCGFAMEAVTKRKQSVICRTAQFYLFSKRVDSNQPCRFDVIGIDGERITHIQNAFSIQGF